jgi:putative Ca2+/H+ antiporter (TMEM165/GDT1 family)
MNLEIILAVFGLVFLAELGDKTQIIILTLAAQRKARTVLAGAMAAFFLLNLVAVAVGTLVYHFIPLGVLQWLAGGTMILFGILSIFKKTGGEVTGEEAGKSFLKVFLLILLMELGDKTQLTLVALTARYGRPFSVFLGGTLALWASSFLAVLLGSQLTRWIPMEKIHKIAGVIFIVFGLALIMGIA